MEIQKHYLVPKHSKITDAEKQKLLEQYHVELGTLPRILKKDPALAKLTVKTGDVIRIDRQSKTAGTTSYYRVVIDG